MTLIYSLVLGLCAFFLIGIGIFQIRSEKPVAFYSGEEPPKPEQVKDIKSWNKKHGLMWIFYGITMIIGSMVGFTIKYSLLLVLVSFVCILLPMIIMVLYHKKLVKDYIL